MTIAAILADKGRAVYTAGPQTSMREAIDLLSDKRVGCVVVVENGDRVSGIVSERDIVREIARHGAEIFDRPIADFMTRRVIVCSENDTIDRVMSVMTVNRVRHLPVVRNGRLSGIISIGDVVKRKIERVERDAEELRNYIATA